MSQKLLMFGMNARTPRRRLGPRAAGTRLADGTDAHAVPRMTLRIEILKLGSVEADSSPLADYRKSAVPVVRPTLAYLILGGAEGPILVDTGFRDPEAISSAGLKAAVAQGEGLEQELARRGLRPADIRYIFHTHLHASHAGKDDVFPASTTVVMNRRELEVGCGGLGGPNYPARDMKHLLDRLHTPGAAWLLDLHYSGPVELVPGIAAEITGGHTEGSMNLLAETDDGIACICSDVVYDIQAQIVAPCFQLNHREPLISATTAVSRAHEVASVKKALQSGAWLLPMHDAPARIAAGGVVIGRVAGIHVPGPVAPLESAATAHHAGGSGVPPNSSNHR